MSGYLTNIYDSPGTAKQLSSRSRRDVALVMSDTEETEKNLAAIRQILQASDYTAINAYIDEALTTTDYDSGKIIDLINTTIEEKNIDILIHIYHHVTNAGSKKRQYYQPNVLLLSIMGKLLEDETECDLINQFVTEVGKKLSDTLNSMIDANRINTVSATYLIKNIEHFPIDTNKLLKYVAKYGNPSLFKQLIDVVIHDALNTTELFSIAVQSDNTGIVRILIDMNLVSNATELFSMAIQCGKPDIVRILLEMNLVPNADNLLSVFSHRRIAILMAMIDHHVDFNILQKETMTNVPQLDDISRMVSSLEDSGVDIKLLFALTLSKSHQYDTRTW